MNATQVVTNVVTRGGAIPTPTCYCTCMAAAMLSLSLRISWRLFVPRMFRKVVWANSLQDEITCQSRYFCVQLVASPGGVMRVLHVGD